jgi:hypothetical protein
MLFLLQNNKGHILIHYPILLNISKINKNLSASFREILEENVGFCTKIAENWKKLIPFYHLIHKTQISSIFL